MPSIYLYLQYVVNISAELPSAAADGALNLIPQCEYAPIKHHKASK